MEFCETGMSSTISNYHFLILFLLFAAFWTSFWQLWVFVCSISNLFLAACSFSQHSQAVSGSGVAVNGQYSTMLIKSGCVPNLASCHISTEQRTLSQVQILAAGHFLAEGISRPSQTYTHTSTQTRTARWHTQSHSCVQKCVSRKDKWDTDLVGVGGFGVNM